MNRISCVCWLVARPMVLAAALTIAAAAHAQTHRVYYVAAEEIEWSYGPSMDHSSVGGMAGAHGLMEGQTDVKSAGPAEMESGSGMEGGQLAGNSYTKVIYQEYTDQSFSRRKQRQQQYLGLLGPVIRAEVGDSISFVFHNKASRPYNVHAYGVQYAKGSEGAPYDDGSDEKGDDLVQPGSMYTYAWSVPEYSGPGPGDGSSIVWPYYSHVQTERDVASGLMGVIIVTRQGQAQVDGRPLGVDRELITVLTVIDESRSWYGDKTAVIPVINGYSTLPAPVICTGEQVRWYLLVLGTSAFIHWHGNTGVIASSGQRADIINLQPSSGVVLDMQPYNPGVWMLMTGFGGKHPAVTHTTYQVLSAGQPGCR